MLERVSFSGEMLLRAPVRAGSARTRGRRNGGGAITGFDQLASELVERIRSDGSTAKPRFLASLIDIRLQIREFELGCLRSCSEQSFEVPDMDGQHGSSRGLDAPFGNVGEMLIEQRLDRFCRCRRWAFIESTGREQDRDDVIFGFDGERTEFESPEIVFEPGEGEGCRCFVIRLQRPTELLAAESEDDAVGIVAFFERCHRGIVRQLTGENQRFKPNAKPMLSPFCPQRGKQGEIQKQLIFPKVAFFLEKQPMRSRGLEPPRGCPH